MPKYFIERHIPGVSGFSSEELETISKKSADVVRDLGAGVQWVESFVAGDKIYCIYIADSENLIREHGRRGGFPTEIVAPVVARLDPTVGGA
jgi:hypothetical protein